LNPYDGPGNLDDGHLSPLDLEAGNTNNLRALFLDIQRRLNQVMRGLDTTHAEQHLPDGSDPLAALAPADHAHAGVSGDGGTFDAANLTSAAAGDGTVLTADGSGGAAWESIPTPALTFTPLPVPLTSTDWDGDAKTNANNGVIDLSAVFGVPAGVKAVLVYAAVNGTSATYSLSLGSDNSHVCMLTEVQVANRTVADNGIIPCDVNGDIYASFYQTVTVTLKILGYWGP
jgi:hypothetical protein